MTSAPFHGFDRFHTASCALSPSVRRKAGLQAFYFCDPFFS